MPLYPWHIVVIMIIAYLLWHLIGKFELDSQELKEIKLNHTNFGLALAFGVLCFACICYIYYSRKSEIPKSLLEASYVIWTATVCAILWRSELPKTLKIVGFPLLVGTVLLHYLFKGELRGVTGFVKKLDAFTDFSGGESGAGLKLSIFLKWLFFFLNAFVVLNFYGTVVEIIHRDRIKAGVRGEGLQEEAINRAVLVLSVGAALFVALALAGTDLRSLSLFSGLVAAGVSIALKDLLANMAAGVLLLWDKSIKTNDVIALDKDRFGIVRSMTMRYLVLEDRNDVRFLVPNSELINKTITNWTQKTRRIRLKLDIGVSYDSSVSQVKDIMKEVALRVPRVLQDPPPRILIIGMGDSTINFQLRFFIDDPENGVRNVMSEIYELLVARFGETGIKIPFPQREIRLLPESLVDINVTKRSAPWFKWLTKNPADLDT